MNQDFQAEQELKSRTVTVGGEREIGLEYWPDFQKDKIIATHLGGIDEVQKQGAYSTCFRYGQLEFKTLKGAIQYYINKLSSLDFTSEKTSIEGREREKTRPECRAEIESLISSVEEDLISRLAEILKVEGPFRQVLILPDGNIDKKNSLERGKRDLRDRLMQIFKDPLTLLIFSKLKPELFKKAIESLSPGQTEKEIMKEAEESIESDKKNRARQIEEARRFLKSL